MVYIPATERCPHQYHSQHAQPRSMLGFMLNTTNHTVGMSHRLPDAHNRAPSSRDAHLAMASWERCDERSFILHEAQDALRILPTRDEGALARAHISAKSQPMTQLKRIDQELITYLADSHSWSGSAWYLLVYMSTDLHRISACLESCLLQCKGHMLSRQSLWE